MNIIKCFHLTSVVALLVMLFPQLLQADQKPPIVIASKSFTESVILGEILKQLVEQSGDTAVHKRQLGGTRIVWNALLNGEVDAYVEYTGTLIHETLASDKIKGFDQLKQVLSTMDIGVTPALGFNNTYAIGVTKQLADKLGLKSISDLREYPYLKLGFGNEFMDRADGWPGLKRRYQLPQTNVTGLDHDLAYRGLASDTIQITDLYATDAEIEFYHLTALKDDLHYFPEYKAIVLYRSELKRRTPEVVAMFNRLAGKIDSKSMIKMNASVKLHDESDAAVAASFLNQKLHMRSTINEVSAWQQFWRHTYEHLVLVAISLSAAIFVSIPLGIVAASRPRLGHVILASAGVIQTIPTLALFVFMIPLLGIGGPPAVMALFLYSLLPIIRNTHAGLVGIPTPIIESATALGLPPGARLKLVELPLATRSILSGIKTSAVINVGTATLSALIGAGGYGQPILTGIRLDDSSLILQGAVPAAAMALLVQGIFELIEKMLLPRGLRL